jgi:hypothetical protein
MLGVLVQNFTELLATALEEIFMVLNFAPSYFRSARSICEKREILHHAKISRYTVSSSYVHLRQCQCADLVFDMLS